MIVIDVDRRGLPGGTMECVDEDVRQKPTLLTAGDVGPAWIGINPSNGKCQLLWLLDPVYAEGWGDTSNVRLLRVVMTMLAELLGVIRLFRTSCRVRLFTLGMTPRRIRGMCSIIELIGWPICVMR